MTAVVMRALVWSSDKERQDSFGLFSICVVFGGVFWVFLDSTTKSGESSLLSGDIGES